MQQPELGRIAATLKELPFPKKLAVELCAECNLACSMCHHPSMRRPKGVLPFELWRRIAGEVARTAPDTECWFSFCGEPFLEPELLLECLRHGAAQGLESLNVNTNGMLLRPEWIDPLLASGVHLVVLGIDGFSKEVLERHRVGADRDTVYEHAERLLARRDELRSPVAIQVQFIVMDGNAHEEVAFRRHWLARKAVVKVRRQLSWGGRLSNGCSAAEVERIPCPWAVTMMHVFWDGRVPRCPGDTEGEEGVGNAWHASLADLWARLGTYRRHHLERDFEALPERCRTCTDWMSGSAERVRPASADVPIEPTCRRT